MRGIGEKHLKQIWHVLLIIKVSGSSLKAFSEQRLKAVKLCHNDKNRQLNQEKREIRKTKATKPTRKKF